LIREGHHYACEGQSVLALESAERGLIRVRRILPDIPLTGMGPPFYVAVERLVPMPMRYHGNAVPGETNGS